MLAFLTDTLKEPDRNFLLLFTNKFFFFWRVLGCWRRRAAGMVATVRWKWGGIGSRNST
jgi:hypothetical protein